MHVLGNLCHGYTKLEHQSLGATFGTACVFLTAWYLWLVRLVGVWVAALLQLDKMPDAAHFWVVDFASPIATSSAVVVDQLTMSSEFEPLSKYFFDETSESEISRYVICSRRDAAYPESQDNVVYTG